MNDRDRNDPETGGKPPEDSPERSAKEDGPEGEPQGLVEEIKEEISQVTEHVQEEIAHVTEQVQEEIEHVKEGIEQVVEHVPKPVRWTVARLFWLSMLALAGLFVLLLVTGLLYLANRTEWAAKELAVVINQTLVRKSDLVFEVRDVKGNPFVGVRLLDASLRFREGDQPPLLAVQVVRVNYSALDLLRGRGAITFDMEQPVVRLGYGENGKLRLPRWEGETKAASRESKTRGFDLNLRIARGSLRVPQPLEGIEGLSLEGRIETGRSTRATVERLSWVRGPLGVQLLSLRGEITQSDSVRCLVRELKTPDLELRGRAAWAPGAEDRMVAVDVAMVRWKWLAQVFKNDIFDVPGEGRFIAHGTIGKRMRGDFDGSFDWNGLELEGRGRFAQGRNQWKVEPFRMRSKAGDLTGRFVYDKDSWEVSGDVWRGHPEQWGPLRLPGWPAGELNGWFRYMVATHGADELQARLGRSQLAGWRADSARVGMWFLDAAPDSFGIHMLRRGGTMELDGHIVEGGWHGRWRAQGLPLEEWPDGRASGLTGTLARGEGTVEGQGGELHVTGDLRGVDTDWFGARLDGWRLARVQGRMLPTPDLEFQTELHGVTFLGVHFDSATGGARLGDRTLGISELTGHAGDTTVTAAGRASWSADRWRLELERAAARSDQFSWTAEPRVALAGDKGGVTFERLVMHDGDARFEVSGRWAAPGGTYSFKGRADRLDLARIGMPKDLALLGITDMALDVNGPSVQPRWSFDAYASRPGAHGHSADSLALRLAGAPGQLEVREVLMGLGEGTLQASGRVERTTRPWPDSLTAAGLERWIADAGRWEGTVRATAFPLERVQAMLPPARDFGGRLDGTLTLAGSPARPELEVEADAKPFSWRDYRVDQARLSGRYRDGRLTVNRVQVSREGVQSSASGQMPLLLRVGRPPHVPDQPMSWKIDVPSGDLGLMPLFVPQIGAASGHFDLSAKVGGTVRHPDLGGSARVRGGVVRLAAREEELHGLDADFRIDEAGVHLDSLRARQGDRGRVTGKGDVRLRGLEPVGYRFDFSLRDFAAIETGFYAAEFDGDFVVTNGPKVRGHVVPQVTGAIECRHAVVLLDFANQTETEKLAATTQPLFWTYRIEISSTSNLHWQPPDGDIEFSSDLTVEQTPDSLIVYGDMRALRGTYYFLSNRFDVRKADLTFDNLNGVNPVLDIEAETRVRQPTGGDNCPATKGAETITARITGRADEPVVALSSAPDDWEANCILKELTVGRFKGETGGLSGDPLDSYLTQAINKTLSAEMSRTFKGYINEWVVEREQGGLLGKGGVVLGVGIPVSKNLQLRYRQRVPGSETGRLPEATENLFERDVEAEYRLNRFFYVTTELKQRRVLTGNTTTIVGTPDFNVNLKARWEY